MEIKFNNLSDLEIITAITLIYKEDIEVSILLNKDEILQEDFTLFVYELYMAYRDLEVKASLLDLINKKYIAII